MLAALQFNISILRLSHETIRYLKYRPPFWIVLEIFHLIKQTKLSIISKMHVTAQSKICIYYIIPTFFRINRHFWHRKFIVAVHRTLLPIVKLVDFMAVRTSFQMKLQQKRTFHNKRSNKWTGFLPSFLVPVLCARYYTCILACSPLSNSFYIWLDETAYVCGRFGALYYMGRI